MANEVMAGMESNAINPDIARERLKATFDPLELTHIFDGGKERTTRRKELENLLFSDPLFCLRDNIYLSTSDLYSATMARSVKLFRLKQDQKWSEDDLLLALRLIRDQNCLSLHHSMFLPALERLASDDQKARWLPLARRYHMVGTYAQTELGHGTNLMELETTATYDKATDEFVLSTPKLSSIKWWPGSLGKTSNHAIVLAQLVVDSKKCGMHPFMVQIRSLVDHTPMPGIKLGVIGQKMGSNHNDNGFLFLNNVRIPRENMLMKNAQVTRAGKFLTSGPNKANYATMIYVRVMILSWSFGAISAAATAAIRYSSVRRQSSLAPGQEESQVLDYQTQQYKLFPTLASGYGFFFIHKVLSAKYKAMLVDMQSGNSKALPEMHAWSSGMKALITDITTYNMEICRRSCGGHGYLRASGLSDMVCEAFPLATVEGENTVLYLQVARYLLKQIAKALTGQQTTGTTEYLTMNEASYICPLQKPVDCRNPDFLCEVYKKRAYRMVLKVAQALQRDMESGKEQAVYMNNNLQPLVRMATAHCYYLAMRSYIEGLASLQVSPPARKILDKLCCLFGVHYIVTLSGDFLEAEAIGLEQLQWLQELELQLLAEIRPDAVTLVDALDFHDETLSSAIGCYDGRAYERLYEAALKEPMNQTEVDPAYDKYLKHLIMEGAQSKL
ncbi:peroxisomal acyl-coenzyme A oxidase 1-like [Mizuhopecten yessoensis]|uniref:Acyl-coenzyme A oxidase n=1 Tax=Mizuhopecten yessoensis TaxID=6573 RepID=A0A210PDX3_MIZYE|nr:peroxisomal acyl-coenzyme A oxidase 1-like [Mizuhopecten yessoensis]OWF34664.1 Peroxisomal acyl-coenzyme A oxidase 1 [Mizuhopecten yessoensis]